LSKINKPDDLFFRRTNNWNYLNNRTCSHLSVHCNPISTPTIFNRRNPQSSVNTKNSWTPMILKLWILRLYKTQIWFIHGTTKRSTNQYILTARYRQPSCTTYKLTNSNNRNNSRRVTLVNSTEACCKNRCYTRPIKSSEILNQPTRSPIRTMLRDLWSKSQIHVNRNWNSINKSIYWVSTIREPSDDWKQVMVS